MLDGIELNHYDVKSFESNLIERLPISQALLKSIRLLGEYRGKQQLFREQSPHVLATLRQAAIIQSTESSNRIEGVTAPLERIKALVAEKTRPRDRSEQEIAGYRDALNTIHANFTDMPFTAGLVLQLHRDLFKHTTEPGGHWKSSRNEITELRPDGSRFVRFQPVAPHLTEDHMNRLHERFQATWNSQEIEPLLLIPAYVLDFLCIHPFRDGNGRVARLLTLLLLYKAGYEVGRFISLELIVEQTKAGYYDSLYRASLKWHDGSHNLLPWTEYFLGVMLLAAYRDFEKRVGLVTGGKGAKTAGIIGAIRDFQQDFSVADLRKCCPHVSVDLIRKTLHELKRKNQVECLGRGAGARWRKRTEFGKGQLGSTPANYVFDQTLLPI